MDVDEIRAHPLLKERARYLGTLEARNVPSPATRSDIEHAIRNPVGPREKPRSCLEHIHPGESLCLVVSDSTRKTAADRVLPVLLDGLIERGCRTSDMTVLVATGIHRPPTRDEVRRILGDRAWTLLGSRVELHDPDDRTRLVHVGTTRRGQPVRIHSRAAESDRLVLLGAAVYHYHAGFGGGRKSLVPGVASRDTIAQNHSLTLDPDADRIHPGVGPGCLDGNPVAEEMLEAARLHPPDFIINTVLDAAGRLAGIFAGELDAAHRAACRQVEAMFRVDLEEPTDLVVASAEGAPNWIQSHKALFNAWRACRPGLVLLVAPCPEGIGDERFRYWMRRPALAALYRELRATPEVLGQTALSTRAKANHTLLVTRLAEPDRQDLHMQAEPDIDRGIRTALDRLAAGGNRRPTYRLMPQARYTVPFPESERPVV